MDYIGMYVIKKEEWPNLSSNPEHFSLKTKTLTTELNTLPSAMFIVLSILYVYTRYHDILNAITYIHTLAHFTLLLPNFPGMIDFEISNQRSYQWRKITSKV